MAERTNGACACIRTRQRRGTETFQFDFEPNGVKESQPLIYCWSVLDQETGNWCPVYVGKAQNEERPQTRYRRRVEALLDGKPYDQKPCPAGYRCIHLALAYSVIAGLKVKLSFLENATDDTINHVEKVRQEQRGVCDGCLRPEKLRELERIGRIPLVTNRDP